MLPLAQAHQTTASIQAPPPVLEGFVLLVCMLTRTQRETEELFQVPKGNVHFGNAPMVVSASGANLASEVEVTENFAEASSFGPRTPLACLLSAADTPLSVALLQLPLRLLLQLLLFLLLLLQFLLLAALALTA